MDIARLRYFVTVVDCGSFVRASEILNISQPALSKAMKLLELELGAKLFVQSGRGILVTDLGQSVAGKARLILQDVKNLALTPNTSTAEVIRLGSFEVFTTYFLGEVIAKFFPEAAIELYELIPGQLEQGLVDGLIDYGITYIPVPHTLLDFHEITQTTMSVLALEGQFSKHRFSDIPFVVPITPVTGAPTKVQGLDGWPDDRIPRNIKYKVAMMESALELCRRGLAAAYLPSFIRELHNESVKPAFQLHELPMPSLKGVSRKQAVYLVKRKSSAEGILHKRLAKAIRQLVR